MAYIFLRDPAELRILRNAVLEDMLATGMTGYTPKGVNMM